MSPQILSARYDGERFMVQCPRCRAKLSVEKQRIRYGREVTGRVECTACPWYDYIQIEMQ